MLSSVAMHAASVSRAVGPCGQFARLSATAAMHQPTGTSHAPRLPHIAARQINRDVRNDCRPADRPTISLRHAAGGPRFTARSAVHRVVCSQLRSLRRGIRTRRRDGHRPRADVRTDAIDDFREGASQPGSQPQYRGPASAAAVCGQSRL